MPYRATLLKHGSLQGKVNTHEFFLGNPRFPQDSGVESACGRLAVLQLYLVTTVLILAKVNYKKKISTQEATVYKAFKTIILLKANSSCPRRVTNLIV